MPLRYGMRRVGLRGRSRSEGVGVPAYYVEYIMPVDWMTVAGKTPTIAADFVGNRAHGMAMADVVTTRAANHDTIDAAGNTLTFGANSVRRSNLGLRYTTDDSMTIGGALASLIKGSQGWLMVEVGVSEVVESTYDIITGPNNAVIIGSDSNRGIIERGGNGVTAGSNNGAAFISTVSNSPGNGRNLDSSSQVIIITWDASGNRKLCIGGGAIVSGTGGLAATGSIYIGRRSGGGAGNGLIRSIRAGTDYLTDAEMQAMSFFLATVPVLIPYGDSKPAASGVATPSSTGWFAKAQNSSNPDMGLFSGGVGGETVEQIEERFFGRTVGAQSITDSRYYDNSIFIFWLGHNTSSAVDTLASLKRMISRLGGEKRWLIILPTISTAAAVGSSEYTRITDMRALIWDTFPAERIIDQFANYAALVPANSNIASGWEPSTYLADAIHNNQTGQDATGKQVYDRIVALGWLGVGGAFPAFAA